MDEDNMMQYDANAKKSKSVSWLSMVGVTVLVIFLYFFMEWVFLITKPSFMSSVYLPDQIFIFVSTASLVSVVYLFFMGLVWLLGQTNMQWVQRLLTFVTTFIPAVAAAFLLLLLIDNFTYTVFRFGIVTADGFFRLLYAVLFIGLIFISQNEIRNAAVQVEKILQKRSQRFKLILTATFFIFFIVMALIPLAANLNGAALPGFEPQAAQKPNIFLITADGVNAENMSVYGYERETTPFLRELSQSTLTAQNAFTNAANTTGSIISLLNSKQPVETGVLYPPDILKSEDAYQHIGAILKANGYYAAQFSFNHYVDAYQLNMQNGFDEANGRSGQHKILQIFNRWLPTNNSYFIYELSNRLVDRLRHIFFIKKMSNPFIQVHSPEDYQDEDKIDSMLALVDRANKPVFAHLHWMGTHGPKFYPREQVFSAEKDANPANQYNWDQDFYDDSILSFDRAMSVFYDELEQRNILENSILIIATDHGQRHTTDQRLPLLIRFPNGAYQGDIFENVQNLDIAPTILDYLDIEQPDWMDGLSLLGNIPQNRPIFAVGVGNVEVEDYSIKPQSIAPPFYQFGCLAVPVCDTTYRLDLTDYSWEEKLVSGYPGQCEATSLNKQQILRLMIDYFEQYQYDSSTLKAMLN